MNKADEQIFGNVNRFNAEQHRLLDLLRAQESVDGQKGADDTNRQIETNVRKYQAMHNLDVFYQPKDSIDISFPHWTHCVLFGIGSLILLFLLFGT